MNAQSNPVGDKDAGSYEAPAKDTQVQASQREQSSKTKKAPSAFRTISEVADELDVQQHVLRFWETKFSQVKPLKRGGGRRYYRPEDVDLLKTIHKLLYTEGYTIKGVQKLMREKGKNQVVQKQLKAENTNKAEQPAQSLSEKQRAILRSMLGELKELRSMISGDK